jgi:putative heme iron utilization protein
VSQDPEIATALRWLLQTQQTAALATLHNGEPALSMVPYALLPQGAGFVIHVSRLATHTADMLATPAVSLLVVAPEGSASSPQELQRASVRGRARPLSPPSEEHANAKALYVARFPSSEQTFSFSDFTLFAIEPRSIRFVGGFARAASLLAGDFVSIMQGGS